MFDMRKMVANHEIFEVSWLANRNAGGILKFEGSDKIVRAKYSHLLWYILTIAAGVFGQFFSKTLVECIIKRDCNIQMAENRTKYF